MPESLSGSSTDTAALGAAPEGDGRREACREDEEAFRVWVDLLPQTVFELDSKGYVVFSNRAGFETFGYDRDDLARGVHATELVAETDRLRAKEMLLAAFSGMARGHEYLGRRKDGSLFPVLIHSTPILREGRAVGLRGLIVDLTEHQRNEERYRISEERYRTIFENSGSPSVLIERDTTIAMCNRAFEELFGDTKANIEGHLKWVDFVPDSGERELMLDYHRQRRGRNADVPSSYEFHLLDKRGATRQVAVTVTMSPGTEQSLAVLRDVTKEREAARAIKDSEVLYRAIFENTGTASVIVEADTTILLANSEWLRLSGYSREEVVGKMSWTQFVVPEDLERMRRYNATRRIGDRDTPQAYEFRFVNRTGEIIEVMNHVAMIPGTQRRIASLMDISARKRAEKQREELQERLLQAEKLEAIGQLAGGIAHDFNNQLTAIAGFAELLEMGLPVGEEREYAQLIGKACAQASELTKKLLAFARKGKYLSVPVDVHRLIRDVSTLLQRSIDRRIEIVEKLEARGHTVNGDPSQLQSALMNLALNARDAMSEGGAITFATAVRVLDEEYCRQQPHEIQPGEFLQIAVQDTGTGMDAETSRRIFEPFFTTKEHGKGTGLGLASVYGAVKQHHGAIHVYSEVGRGSCFTVYLPLTPEMARAVPVAQARVKPATACVLIVDDEELIVSWLKGFLEKTGYRVQTCRDGIEAVEYYGKHWQEIDVVILDLIMPRLGGGDTFVALRAVNPDVAVIIASGFSVDGEAQRILDGGAKGFLQKPFDGPSLLSLIEAQLSERRR